VALWEKAGQRSLQRSASVEAIEQFTRALAQIATLPSTPSLRGEEIKVQVALITPVVQVKGWAAPEAKATVERARLLIEEAEARGEAPEDPLLLFKVLHGLYGASLVEFNAELSHDLAAQFLKLAEKQGTSFPRVLGHVFLGASLMLRGDFTKAKAHFDQGMTLYEPTEHLALAIRFGEDQRIATPFFRSKTLWALGYPDAASADSERALNVAREIDHAASLLWALAGAFFVDITCATLRGSKYANR
jgi:hypothetical protein